MEIAFIKYTSLELEALQHNLTFSYLNWVPGKWQMSKKSVFLLHVLCFVTQTFCIQNDVSYQYSNIKSSVVKS